MTIDPNLSPILTLKAFTNYLPSEASELLVIAHDFAVERDHPQAFALPLRW